MCAWIGSLRLQVMSEGTPYRCTRRNSLQVMIEVNERQIVKVMIIFGSSLVAELRIDLRVSRYVQLVEWSCG